MEKDYEVGLRKPTGRKLWHSKIEPGNNDGGTKTDGEKLSIKSNRGRSDEKYKMPPTSPIKIRINEA